MPLPQGTRYRVKTTKSGKKVRLAFKKGTNKVIEAQNVRTGETHTMLDFMRDRARRKRAWR